MNQHSLSQNRLLRARLALTLLGASVLLSGCAMLGGHVKGSFACRAPQGSCAPTSVIDRRALGALGSTGAVLVARMPPSQTTVSTAPSSALQQDQAEPGDTARTRERKLRIVLPAHVDASGIFHEQAAVWAIAEPADWAARLRGPSKDQSLRGLARAIKRAYAGRSTVKVAPAQSADKQIVEMPEKLGIVSRSESEMASLPDVPPHQGEAVTGEPAPAIEGSEIRPSILAPRSSLPVPFIPNSTSWHYALPSPPPSPSAAREDIAGDQFSAPEGFGALPPRSRTPHPPAVNAWPRAEAIEAARHRANKKASSKPVEQAHPATAAQEGE
jgi:conjugal transfer pilus assembly protein TraV